MCILRHHENWMLSNYPIVPIASHVSQFNHPILGILLKDCLRSRYITVLKIHVLYIHNASVRFIEF